MRHMDTLNGNILYKTGFHGFVHEPPLTVNPEDITTIIKARRNAIYIETMLSSQNYQENSINSLQNIHNEAKYIHTLNNST